MSSEDWQRQASIYTPQAYRGSYEAAAAKSGDKQGRTTVVRKAGGALWEDPSLMEWDPAHFRLFIGSLDPNIRDSEFEKAFKGDGKYKSFVKAKVVRDKFSGKSKGFGFVAYSDPEDFLQAWKDLNGKYVGARPVKISRATTGVQSVDIGARKARQFDRSRRFSPYKR